MKKVFYLIGAAALILTAACQKETVSSNNGITLTATLEQQVDAKTSLNEGGLIYWSENNAINVFTTGEGAGNFKFDLVQGAGTAVGKFKNDAATGTPAYAIYPYNAETTIDGSVITFNLPAVQKYVPNSFANDANVSVAAVSGSSMAFKNVCGALKLNIAGIGIIDKITVKGNNGEKLWGTFTADAASATPSCQVSGTPSDEEKVITLDMDEPVLLKNVTPTSFILVVPVGVFGDTENGGFEVKGYLGEREIFSFNTTDSRNIINRSNVRAMPTKFISPSLPNEYEAITYLSSGTSLGQAVTPYLDLGFKHEPGYTYTICFQMNILSNNQSLFGTWEASQKYGAHVALYQNAFYFCGGSGIESNTRDVYNPFVTDTQKITLNTSNGKLYVGDAQVGIGQTSTLEGGNVYLFRRNSTNQAQSCMSCFYFNVADENEDSIFYGIPARRIEDQELGMYDYVSGNFYTNVGGGSFETE